VGGVHGARDLSDVALHDTPLRVAKHDDSDAAAF
jgi:hypothetical protein